MFLRLLLLFVLTPIIELAVLIEVGRLLGTWTTVALVVSTGMAGAWLARSQGLRAFRRLQDSLSAGSFPGRELLNGVLILAGGLLLLTPGVITDIVGFLVLIPGSRNLIQAALVRRVRRHPGTDQHGFDFHTE